VFSKFAVVNVVPLRTTVPLIRVKFPTLVATLWDKNSGQCPGIYVQPGSIRDRDFFWNVNRHKKLRP